MDWNNLTTPQVAFLAAAATVASAVVAGTAALVSTIVSGWNSRRLARQTALREYRLRVMAPALEEVERRIAEVMLVLHKGKPVETLYEQEPRDRKVFATPTDELHEAALDFAMWDHWCWWAVKLPHRTPLSPEERTWMLDQLDRSALAFREAVENFIFQASFAFALRRRLRTNRKAREKRLQEIVVRVGVTDAIAPSSESTTAPSSTPATKSIDTDSDKDSVGTTGHGAAGVS
jgi:hypothetical protein